MKKLALTIWACLIFALPLQAAEIKFPALSGQVVDEAGVLSPSEKMKLTQLLESDQTNQVAIAVVQDLQGMDGREYGIELARRWQIGQKGKDNGVLILLAVKDRYVGIEVGYGLEGILPDSVTGRIIREQMIPPLKENLNYYQSLLNGAVSVMKVITTGEKADESGTAEDILSMLFTLLIIYLILSGKMRGGGFGGFGGGRGGFGGGGFFRGGGGSFGGGGAGRRF